MKSGIEVFMFGNALAALKPANATENAFAVRGLIEAYRVSGDAAFLTSAANSFNAMYADFNFSDGVFNSQGKYSIDNVAVIMGAINSAIIHAGDAVNQDQANELFTSVYLNIVNKSGLQQSVPPVDAGKDKFEQEHPMIYYGYPTLPMPPMAGSARDIHVALPGKINLAVLCKVSYPFGNTRLNSSTAFCPLRSSRL